MKRYPIIKTVSNGERGFETGSEITSSGVTSGTLHKINYAYMKALQRACNWKDCDKSTTLTAGYTETNTTLGASNHIVEFGTNVYKGDKVTTATNGTYTVYQSGFYFVHATVFVSFIPGSYDATEYALYFPDDYLSLDLYKNGVIETPSNLSRLPVKAAVVTTGDTGYMFFETWSLNYQNLVYLTQGEYIDLRLNLRNFVRIVPITFTIKGLRTIQLYALPLEKAALRN